MKVTLWKKQTKNNITLYLVIRNKGKRTYEPLSLYLIGDKAKDKATLKLAEEVKLKREYELNQQNLLGIEPNKYLFHIAEELISKKSGGTFVQYGIMLNRLKEYFINDIKIKDVTAEMLEKFQDHLLSKMQSNTARHKMVLLKAVFNYAIKKEYLTKNPFNKVETLKAEEKPRGYLTVEEIKAIEQIETRATETKRAFLFACFTGLRFSDVRTLKYEDIKDNIIQKKMIKTSSFIRIPLNIQSKKYLYANNNILPLPHTNVFNLPTLINCNKALKVLFKKAGIKKNKISFHLSRHTFGTLSIKAGNDIYTVSKQLGHKDLNTTKIYAKLTDSEMIEAMEKIDNLYMLN